MTRLALKLLNGAYDLVAGAMILSAALFSTYSIWDNAQIYRSALDVQDSIRQYRPVVEEEEGSGAPGFGELREINPDVVAWLTLEGTNIDYPVLLGKDNLEYMNKDVYGDVSLAGSIYLDTRCDPNFEERYSLIYGHNMDQHLMFGDLALYKDKDFFSQHTEGQIITPAGTQDYQVVAVLQIPAGTDKVFNPDVWKNGFDHMPEYLRQSSIWYHSELLDRMEEKPWGVQVAALVTCSEGSTNDRTVVILIRERPDWHEPDPIEVDPYNPHDPHSPYDPQVGDEIVDPDEIDDPHRPEDPTDPGGSTDPHHPDNPHNPDSGGSGETDDPDDIDKPDKPDNPDNPDNPGGSNRPGGSGNNSGSGGSDVRGGSGGTGNSGNSGGTNQSDDPNASGIFGPPSGNGPKRTGDGQDPAFWYKVIGGIVAFIAVFETVDRVIRRRREEL